MAWVARETRRSTVGQAQRSIEPRTARYWKIVNPTDAMPWAKPVAYKLVQRQCLSFLPRGIAAVAAWRVCQVAPVGHTLRPAERYAAGDYPTSSQAEGWTTSLRREEEGPDAGGNRSGGVVYPGVQPWSLRQRLAGCRGDVGFRLQPAGFFDGNPASTSRHQSKSSSLEWLARP